MRAGRLRERIRIERPVFGVDAIHAPNKTWEEVATRQANFRVKSGREGNGAGTDNSETSLQITIRRLPGETIDSSWRIVDVRRGDLFDIVAVNPSPFYNDIVLDVRRGGSREP